MLIANINFGVQTGTMHQTLAELRKIEGSL